MYKNFEDFLYEYYSENVNPTCLDDMLPECTADWIGELDTYDLMELADRYGRSIHTFYDNALTKIQKIYQNRG